MLKNKVVVVTGGSGLIGRSFVEQIVESNGIAIIADVDFSMGQRVKKCFPIEQQSNIEVVELDITNKNSIKKVIVFLENKYGHIDALVNNAYPRNDNYGKHFFDVKYDDFVENVGLNLGGYFLTSQQFSQYFKSQGYGNIVNISSIYGVISPKFEIYHNTNMTTPVEYVAIKSGLLQLTKYMAKYFKGMNIRVNSISPGGILNSQPEEFIKKYNSKCLSKGMLEAQDLKGVLLFLLSDSSLYVNGQNIVIDDGFIL